MKINEIVAESKSAPLRQSTQKSTPGLQTWPDLDNGNVPYLQYRMGLAMAIAPGDEAYNHGPIGGQFTTIAYTDADQEILDNAAKIMGIKPVNRSSKRSEELDSVTKTSPTRKVGPISLKKKK
jgi:hypothetical protein